MLLVTLDASQNRLTTLDLVPNTILAELYCVGNLLTSIDLKANTGLRTLDVEHYKLKALELGTNTMLMGIACGYNAIEALNLSANTRLKELYCVENKLKALDLTNNTKLKMLHLDRNQLGDINWTKLSKLYSLSLVGNQLSADLLTRLLDALPKAPEVTPEEQDSLKWGVANISENPGTGKANTTKARENGWKVVAEVNTGINGQQQSETEAYLRYDQISTTIHKSAAVAKIVLYSTDGRLLWQSKEQQGSISLRDMPSGIYIAVAYNQNGRPLSSLRFAR